MSVALFTTNRRECLIKAWIFYLCIGFHWVFEKLLSYYLVSSWRWIKSLDLHCNCRFSWFLLSMILSRFSVTSSLIYDFLSKSDRKVSFFQSKEGLKPRPGFLSGLRRHNKRIKLKDYVGSSTLPGRYTAAEVRFQLYLHCFCSLMTEWNKEKEHKQAKRTYQNIIFLKLTEELSSFETWIDSYYPRLFLPQTKRVQ